ncbi:MAG TPA: hypothetical protein VIW80_00780 [Pyrinomonadaceae bacterium]
MGQFWANTVENTTIEDLPARVTGHAHTSPVFFAVCKRMRLISVTQATTDMSRVTRQSQTIANFFAGEH